MKKITFMVLTFSLLLGSTATVNAASDVSKTANVIVQAGTLDITVDNNIDFGTVQLDGTTQAKANIGSPVAVAVADANGDGKGWDARVNISPLTGTPGVLPGQQYDFKPAGSVVNGTGVTAKTASVGVAPGTDIGLVSGDSTAVSGGITLNPGFLTLTVANSAQAGTYTGTATFSVVALP